MHNIDINIRSAPNGTVPKIVPDERSPLSVCLTVRKKPSETFIYTYRGQIDKLLITKAGPQGVAELERLRKLLIRVDVFAAGRREVET